MKKKVKKNSNLSNWLVFGRWPMADGKSMSLTAFFQYFQTFDGGERLRDRAGGHRRGRGHHHPEAGPA